MANQHLAPRHASKGSSARKSKAIDLDSIMMGIEEYLNDNESDQEQKSHDDNDESDRNKDDKVDNDDDEATVSSRDVPANNLNSAQGKEDGNIDNRHNKHEGEENNISHLNSDAMQPLEHGLVGEIKDDHIDGETQASRQVQVLGGEEPKPFEAADVQSVQQDTLPVEVGKAVGRDEGRDRENEDKLIEGSGPIKRVEEHERKLEVTSDLEGNSGQDGKTFSQVGPPVDQSNGIKENQHPESSMTRAVEDIVGQAKDVKEGHQDEEVPTNAEQLEDTVKQTEIIDRQKEAFTESESMHHESPKDVKESDSRDKVVEAVAEPGQGTGRTGEPERVGLKAESAQNIGESVANEELAFKMESVEDVNEAINSAGKEDEHSAAKLESAGDVTEQINNVEDVDTEAGRMKDEVTAKRARQENGSEEPLTKDAPVGDTVKQSEKDRHEKAIVTEGLIEHESEDDSGKKTDEMARNVSETVKDTEKTECALPQSELIEESEKEGGHEETSTEPAPVEHELEDDNGNEMAEYAFERAKDTEEDEHAAFQGGSIEEKAGQSELVEEEGEKEGGREETSTEPAPIERKPGDSSNEMHEDVSETAKDAEEDERAPPQSELIEEKVGQNELVEEEGEKGGGRGETSTEPTPFERETEDDKNNGIAEDISEPAKDTEKTEHAPSQSELIEGSEKEGGREETSTEPAPVEHELEDDNGNEMPEDVSETAKDTEEGELAPPQSEPIEEKAGQNQLVQEEGEKEMRLEESSTGPGPIECKPDDSRNEIPGDVSETAKDTEESEHACPQSEFIEEKEGQSELVGEKGEKESGREETSTEAAPIEHESANDKDNEIAENASEPAKDTEEGEHAPPQSELVGEKGEKEGGREETSTEPAPIERQSANDKDNEITENASEPARDTEEDEHTPPQGEPIEEKAGPNDLIEVEGGKEGGREESSTVPAPIERKPDDSSNGMREDVSEIVKDTEGEHAPPQSELIEEKAEQSEMVEEEGEKEGGREETSTESAPIEPESANDKDNETAENASEMAKDTGETEHPLSQSKLLAKEDKHGETSVGAGSVECESESIGDLEQSDRADETFKTMAEPPKQTETDDGLKESITKVELGEHITEPNTDEKLVDQTRALESRNEDAKKEGEQFGENLVEQSKKVEAKNQHEETTREVMSGRNESNLAQDNKEGTSLKDKVAGGTSGLIEEVETHEEVPEESKKAARENELQELTPEAESVKDIQETEVVTEEKVRPEEVSKEPEPVASTTGTVDEVNKENETSEKPATRVEIEIAEKQPELAREKTELKTSTKFGAVEGAVESAKNPQESVSRGGSIEEAAASLESEKDGAEEGDEQKVQPVADPSQNVDYSLEPVGVNNADADIASIPSTDSPNKVQNDEPIQADLPINSNSDKSSSISPLADTEDAEAAYSGTGVDQPDRVSIEAEEDTNREITTIRFPGSPVADNSGLTEENKRENSAHNDPMGENSETPSDDHKSAQTDGEEVEKNIEAVENAENVSSTDSRKPEQPISSTSFDAETEAILKGLDNPQELLKELELERRNEPVYIFTSLAGGGFHIIPRTNRLATILQANRIEFTYRDLGTDPQARNLWKAHANGKQLPGLVRGSDVVGNWQDIDEANEEYRLDELLYST